MSRYIDADIYEEKLKEIEDITALADIEMGEDPNIGIISIPLFTIKRIIKRVPTIDIVRCKECAKWLGSSGICMWDKSTSLFTKADDFCSYGVKKGADDE